MSRVAKTLIDVSKVEIKQQENVLNIKGKSGENVLILPKGIEISINEKKLSITGDATTAMKGTFNRLITNAVKGADEKFTKTIVLKGVGFKVSKDENRLKFMLGFSHDKFVAISNDVDVELKGMTQINLSACNKQYIGDYAAKLCRLRKYNKYKGTGVLDQDKIDKGLYIIKDRRKK